MNEYPVWWDKTVTIYNKYINPITKSVVWIRHVVDGCYWNSGGTILNFNGTQILSNDVVCRIREDDRYLPRGQWKDLPNDLMSGYFTLGQSDILILGEVDDIIDESASGHRSNDLIAKYKNTQDCIVVKRFSDNTGAGLVMPHYRVVGD